MVDRLIKANEQWARINKELGADQVNAVFIELGVSGKDEIQRALELTRQGRESSPLEFLEDCLAGVELCLQRHPEKAHYACSRIERAARLRGMLEVHTEVNGNGSG